MLKCSNRPNHESFARPIPMCNDLVTWGQAFFMSQPRKACLRRAMAGPLKHPCCATLTEIEPRFLTPPSPCCIRRANLPRFWLRSRHAALLKLEAEQRGRFRTYHYEPWVPLGGCKQAMVVAYPLYLVVACDSGLFYSALCFLCALKPNIAAVQVELEVED